MTPGIRIRTTAAHDRGAGRRGALLAVAALLLAGCATRPTLPYRPDPQPAGARLAADYQVVGDQLRVEIETDRRRLEQALIVRPDGSLVAPRTVEHAPLVAGSPLSIGIGGGTFGGRGGVGVGTGVGVGIPVGGSPRVEGNTVVWFPLAEAGPAPWRLHVKVSGAEPAAIVLDAGPAGSVR